MKNNEIQEFTSQLRFLKSVYRVSLLARRLEERIWILLKTGAAPFWIGGMGHEVPQAIISLLLQENDWLVPYYRDICAVLAKGMTPTEVMLGFFARARDPSSGGRQMPSHWALAEKRIISASSPIATQIPHGAGLAFARRLLGYREEVVAVFFGDGATSQGDFHEGLNFAGIHKLPILFICENNSLAISVPQTKQMAVKDVAVRAAGYGFPGITLAGTAFYQLIYHTKKAIERARSGKGPTLIEIKLPRLTHHSSSDDQKDYRSETEIMLSKQEDILEELKRYLLKHNALTEEDIVELEKWAEKEIDNAVQQAEQSPPPDPASLFEHLYAKGR